MATRTSCRRAWLGTKSRSPSASSMFMVGGIHPVDTAREQTMASIAEAAPPVGPSLDLTAPLGGGGARGAGGRGRDRAERRAGRGATEDAEDRQGLRLVVGRCAGAVGADVV